MKIIVSWAALMAAMRDLGPLDRVQMYNRAEKYTQPFQERDGHIGDRTQLISECCGAYNYETVKEFEHRYPGISFIVNPESTPALPDLHWYGYGSNLSKQKLMFKETLEKVQCGEDTLYIKLRSN